MVPVDLVVLDDPTCRRVVRLSGSRELLIGRDASCDLAIDDDKVSRRHARLVVSPGGFEIVDLASRNGTHVNDRPVTRARLQLGDRIRIGGRTLVLEPVETDAPTSIVFETEVPDLDAPLGRSRGGDAETSEFPMLAPPEEPRRIGPYRILERLGSGGMGVVYAAVEDGTDRRVAVKTLLPRGPVDEALRKRFLREIRVSSRLAHPNVVRFLDAGSEGYVPYLVSELVEGRSLQAHLQGTEPLPMDRIERWLSQLVAAIAHAHAQRIIHRDLKPGNVLVEDATDRILVLDFGLGRALDASESRHTFSGQSLGTLLYMAPEQLEDAREADERSDVYGLGALLYTLLAGAPPFSGRGRFQLVDSILRKPPIPVEELRPGTPKHLREIVRRALAKRPEDRFQSVDEIVAALGAE